MHQASSSKSALSWIAVVTLGCSSSQPEPTSVPIHGTVKGRPASAAQACLWSGPGVSAGHLSGVVASFLFGDTYPAPPPWQQVRSSKWNRQNAAILNVTLRFATSTEPINGRHSIDGAATTAQFVATDDACQPTVNESANSGYISIESISGAVDSEATGNLKLEFADGTVEGTFDTHLYCSFAPDHVDPGCAP